MAALTRKQVTKLGERLRKAPVPADDDLGMLDQFRDAHLAPMLSVLVRLQSIPLPASASFSARQKNAHTIIEKLRREKTALIKMQDVAGVRVVLNGGRLEQDASTEVRGASVSRTEVIDYMKSLSQQLSDAEKLEAEAGTARAHEASMPLLSEEDARHELARLERIRRDAEQALTDVKQLMGALEEVVPHAAPNAITLVEPPPADDPVSYFLLAYRRSAGVALAMMPFSGSRIEDALRRRTALQKEWLHDEDVEVVLLASSSRDELLKTHSRYFKETAELAAVRGSGTQA